MKNRGASDPCTTGFTCGEFFSLILYLNCRHMKTRNVSAMVEREFHVLTVKWKLYGEPVHFTALWELKC